MHSLTSVKDVEQALLKLDEYKLATEWTHNDIIKMKIAISYDAWINDIADHNCFQTLKEHVEYILENPSLVDPTFE